MGGCSVVFIDTKHSILTSAGSFIPARPQPVIGLIVFRVNKTLSPPQNDFNNLAHTRRK